MSVAARSPKAEVEALERQLYTRLGLSPNANREELASAYEAVQAYLDGAPRDLRDWAKARSGEVDEAYALLSDPAALAGAVALVGAVERPARQPGGPATPPARRAYPSFAEPDDENDEQEADDVQDTDPDEDDLDDVVASVSPDAHRDTVRPNTLRRSAKATRAAAKTPTRRTRTVRAPRRTARRLVALVGIAAAAVVIAVAGYQFGPGANAGQPSPSNVGGATGDASPSPTLDVQKVAGLMQKISANPKDATSLLGLADAYFQAGDYKTAADWAQKVVTADPKNVQGYIALGAAQYNQTNEDGAETAWKQAITLDPKNIEAHYDLGFLYFAKQPQDKAGAIKEWQTVVSLDPTSDLATSLKAHLDSLTGSPAPSGSASPSGAPAPSASASAAPSASAVPSASAGPASPAASPGSSAQP